MSRARARAHTRTPPTVEQLFIGAFALLGLRLGLRPIGDNSTFVHLRTGIDVVAGKGIPRVDPYSFTATGEPWVVQSWLASAAYGLAERVGGIEAVVLLNGALYAAIAAAIALLARTGVGWRTCAAAATAIGIGLSVWAPRPLAFGLLAFAATVLVVERAKAPWLLVPITWVWVNTHGSFALVGVWFVLLALTRERRQDVRRYGPWWVAGLAAGAVNPLGPKLLAFPLAVVTKSENFTRVVEWGAPSFRRPFGIVALVAIAATVALLAGSRRRVRPSDAIVVAGFLALGLASQRNLGPAAIVIAPVLGRALAPAVAPGEPDRAPARIGVAFTVVITLSAHLFLAIAVRSEPLDLDAYPVDALAEVPDGARLVTTDVVSGYLVLARGREASVFMDDRYDMYPSSVVRDYVALYDGSPGAVDVLEEHDIEAVVWPKDAPLRSILEGRSDEWERTFVDDGWAVFVRARR